MPPSVIVEVGIRACIAAASSPAHFQASVDR